jgi:hypothetical protein
MGITSPETADRQSPSSLGRTSVSNAIGSAYLSDDNVEDNVTLLAALLAVAVLVGWLAGRRR